MDITGITPNKEIETKAFSYLLETNNLDRAKKLSARINKKPVFTDNSIAKFSSLHAHKGNINLLEDLANLGLGVSIPENYIHEAAINYVVSEINLIFDYIVERIKDYYNTMKTKPSLEVTGAKLTKFVDILNEDINMAMVEFTYGEISPFTLIPQCNIKLHNKFKSRVKKIVRSTNSRISNLRKENPNCIAREHATIHKGYATCLELIINQALRNDFNFVPLNKLEENLGIAVTEEDKIRALSNHIEHSSGDTQYGNYSDFLKENLKKSGYEINIKDNVDNIVRTLNPNHRVFSDNLQYTLKLAGMQEFPEESKKRIRNSALNKIEQGYFISYKNLTNFVGNLIPFSEYEQSQISRGVISGLKSSPHFTETVEKIIKETGVIVRATNNELKDIVTNYFKDEKSCDNPMKLAILVNQQLNKSQIHDRYFELMRTGKVYEAKRLYENTGIGLESYEAIAIANRFNVESIPVVIERLNEVFNLNLVDRR